MLAVGVHGENGAGSLLRAVGKAGLKCGAFASVVGVAQDGGTFGGSAGCGVIFATVIHDHDGQSQL